MEREKNFSKSFDSVIGMDGRLVVWPKRVDGLTDGRLDGRETKTEGGGLRG